ncbi:auxin efflux carrier, partial [Tanacetum coccineum]
GESSKNDMNVNFNQGLQVNKMNKSNANAASMVNKMNKSNANAASTVNNVTMKNSFGALTDDEEMGSKPTTIINEDSDEEKVDEEMVFDDRHESHVADSNLHKMCSLVFRHWDWSSNGAWCNKGTRIILGWNHNDVDIMVVTQDDQAVHARVWLKLEKKEVFCSFIYAHNRYNQRRSLWKGLSHHKLYVRDRPWCLLGDFNSTLYLDETTTGTSRIDIAMREFKECVDDIEVMDVQNSGISYLDQIQTLLDKDPFNSILCEKEADCIVEFNQSVLLEERFLKQKAKIYWLKEDDSNSAYFHKAVKSRVSRSRIDVVMNGDGLIFANDKVPEAFVTHYEEFLGKAAEINGSNDTYLFTKCLDDQVALHMVRTMTNQEVKEAMFSMGDDKSPGLGGYTAAFFKEAWEIVGTEVTQAIREFFINGNILKEINHTIIALIPKDQTKLEDSC